MMAAALDCIDKELAELSNWAQLDKVFIVWVGESFYRTYKP